ncbi:MAG: UPF0149 family protein [Gammaproteobacteria bacterium]
MPMSFQDLDRLLRRFGAPVDAAECHGALCGALCAPTSDTDAWLAHSLEDVADARDARPQLEALAADTLRELQNGDFEFAPCLPDDDEPLTQRTAALGEWCEGFLFGIGASSIEHFDALPESVQEVIRDVVEMARVGMPAGDDTAGDEGAYVELVEYLRAGVQLVYDDMNPASASPVLAAPPRVQ